MYALADCNNFFVSCEGVFRPDLVGKPVVVLSNNDGCAISRSNEAKKLGIKMGQPYFEWAALAKQHNVTVFSSNFLLYGDMSKRVQSVLRSAAPSIEVYSIDESFLNLTGMEGMDLDKWAKELSAKCLQYTGIPISVGVSPTKTLAKVASKLCKQYPKLRGGCYMYKQEDIEKVLKKFPLDDIWGIGRRYFRRFHDFYGMNTAYDFYKKERVWVQNEMGVTGVRTWEELHGTPAIEFGDSVPAKKQIMVSRSFAKEITDIQELSEQVSMYCAMAVEKLRKQNSLCQSVIVFVRTNIYNKKVAQQRDGRLVTFMIPTDSSLEINKAVMAALRDMFRNGMAYKKAGVMICDISTADSRQLGLFEEVDHIKHAKLMETVDAINNKSGGMSLFVGSQSNSGFKMNRNSLSPAYTTDWNQIPVVNCR